MAETTPVIRLDKFSFAYPGADDFILKDVCMDIFPGECHCVTGPTGSGKTTLLLALKRNLSPGREKGDILYSPLNSNPHIGIILQNPETQILSPAIGAEIAFGLENYCVNPDDMPGLVRAVLPDVGLEKPLSFKTSSLSMGQKYRLLMASFFVMNPGLMLLDEPCAQLDNDGIQKLKRLIKTYKEKGISFLISEHAPERLSDICEKIWAISNNGTVSSIKELPVKTRFIKPPEIKNESDETVISAKDLIAGGDADHPVLSDISFSIKKGRRAVLQGPNGAGKTTLLRCLTGFIKPFRGSITISGKTPDAKQLRRHICYLQQNPEKQIFEDTVLDEVMFTAKRSGHDKREAEKRAEDALVQCGIDGLSGHSPHKLSYGQKHLVTLASVIACRPELVILDDPFAGLDKNKKTVIMKLLADINEAHGITCLMTSHADDDLREWAHTTLRIDKGKLIEAV